MAYPWRVNNFGDVLGPRLIQRILARRGVELDHGDGVRLLSVGSVLHFATAGSVVWGTGRNGKVSADQHYFTNLDVRALRGPMTHRFLHDKGIEAPEIFGDPGLLTAQLFPEIARNTERKSRSLTVVPNLHDLRFWRRHPATISPTDPLDVVLRRIAESELVVGSSLHAIVVADSLGVPSRLIRSQAEPEFKYRDYYLGRGVSEFRPARDISSAINAGATPLPAYDPHALIAAFPYDLWTNRRHENLPPDACPQ